MHPTSLGAAGIALLVTLVSTPALAHFRLIEPENIYEQDGNGSPQKNPPCGDTDDVGGLPGATSGAVTTFTEGDTVTLELEEVIFHPGHYRVLLAADVASLPSARSPGDADDFSPCGSTPIDDHPKLPLLADGVLEHSDPLPDVQTAKIKLPAGFTCERCVLQVVEFMSDHGLNQPGGCFYHHCATVSIGPASSGDGGGSGAPAPAAAGDGGGCSVAHPAGDGALAGLALATLVLRRRRLRAAR